MTTLKVLLKKHYITIILAFLVGFISVGPQLFFIYQLGNDYQGIHLLAIDDEDIYMSRMKEITDGHPLLGSVWFYEYKHKLPLYPPTSDLILVSTAKLLNLSITNLLLVVKFILPATLFVLIYLFILILVRTHNLTTKLLALAGASLVVLAYDMTNFRQTLSYLFGQTEPQTLLLWTRPSNPIHGAIFIFSFLIIIYLIHQKENKILTIIASTIMGIAVSSYFFSGAFLISFLTFLIFLSIMRKDFEFIKNTLIIFFLAFLISAPYWIMSLISSKDPEYLAAALRTGLIYGHNLVLNKIVITTTILFFVLTFKIWKNKKILFDKENYWWWFSLALMLGSIWAFNQQVITGRSIFPPHFTQYTIPTSIIVLLISSYYFLKNKKNILNFISILIITSSITYGSYVQVKAYENNFDKFKDTQKIGPVFSWLNANTVKDSVLLVLEEDEFIERLVPAYTHNNLYKGTYIFFSLPDERLIHNYMTELKLKNINPDNVKLYLEDLPDLFLAYFGTIEDIKGSKKTEKLEWYKNEIIKKYPEFYKDNFEEVLKKYKIDYILSTKALDEKIKKDLNSINLISEINGYYIYSI